MKQRTLLLFTGAILLLVLVAAATGVFSQTAGAPIDFVTVRGEQATYQGSGLYRYDPASVAREGMIWDVIDISLALPLFLVAIVLSWRGWLRGHLLLGGMLFYFFYKYLMYAVMVAFNPLFLVYVGIFALSAAAFFLNLRGINVSSLPSHVSARFPRWLFISFTLLMSVVLIVLWLARIITYTIAGRFPAELAGMTTLVTQAFDLGMVVPLLVATALLLWRHSVWGYLIGGISLTYGFIMSVALPAWIVAPLISSGHMNLVEAAPFTLLCLVGLYVSGRFFWSMREQEEETTRPHRELLAE